MTIKCTDCGRFIGDGDLFAGRARHHEHREIADIYGTIKEEEYFLCKDCEGHETTNPGDRE